jgi:hypothetical protein
MAVIEEQGAPLVRPSGVLGSGLRVEGRVA